MQQSVEVFPGFGPMLGFAMHEPLRLRHNRERPHRLAQHRRRHERGALPRRRRQIALAPRGLRAALLHQLLLRGLLPPARPHLQVGRRLVLQIAHEGIVCRVEDPSGGGRSKGWQRPAVLLWSNLVSWEL